MQCGKLGMRLTCSSCWAALGAVFRSLLPFLALQLPLLLSHFGDTSEVHKALCLCIGWVSSWSVLALELTRICLAGSVSMGTLPGSCSACLTPAPRVWAKPPLGSLSTSGQLVPSPYPRLGTDAPAPRLCVAGLWARAAPQVELRFSN